jgi:hypothetical protein
MLKNYLLTAWRNIRQNKVFSFINIIGLSIGISASLVIYLIVAYNLSFDRFQKDRGRIYRVVSDFVFSGEPAHNSGVSGPLPDAVKRELTGLDEVTPLYVWDPEKISISGHGASGMVVFKQQTHIVFPDESYFRLVSYDWLSGSPAISLRQPFQAVLTESAAHYYFPGLAPAQVIGRRMDFNDTMPVTVAGIVRDIPYHTDFTFRIFLSRSTLDHTDLRYRGSDSWHSTAPNSQLFVKLNASTQPEEMERRMNALGKKYRKDDPGSNFSTHYRLQPLSDMHFNANYSNFFWDDPQADKPTLYGLLAVGGFLLLLACINFINLSTARSSQRAKEIGVRKAIGGSRRQLLLQFLGETFLLTLFAAGLSLLIAPLLLQVFADFIPKGFHFGQSIGPSLIVFLLLLVGIVSLLSGLYPAFILSSYRPVLVLKNQLHTHTGRTRGGWIRKTLTVSQFVIAQVFIIATILVSKQIRFSLNEDMGFKKEAILYARTSYLSDRDHRQVLMNKIKATPGVNMVSLSNAPPSFDGENSTSMKYQGEKGTIETQTQMKYADSNYCRLYQLKFLAGHDLSSTSDSVHQLLINENYSRLLGFTDPHRAIGKLIEWNDRQNPIVGVIADFHQKSLHEPIKPLVIVSMTRLELTLNVALAPQPAGSDSWKNTIAGMAKAWSEVYPDDDFDYHFEDETIARFYQDDQNVARLLGWATGLSIFISCLGLLGLVIYVTDQRTKEIGIRKIIGASVTQLIALLSADFLKLIGLAFLITVPIAWWGTHKWLENFAYRTGLSWWIFLAGGGIMGGIAFIILFIRTFQAALANPVNSLRTE